MKAIILLAGAAALAVSGPAAADPKHHHGHDNGHANHAAQHHAQHHAQGRAEHHAVHRARQHAERVAVHHATDRDRHRDNDRHWRNEGHRHHARFARGEHYRPGYAVVYSYNRIPWRYRHEYRLSDRYRYYYSDGYIYVVDPRTMLIEQVIAALL